MPITISQKNPHTRKGAGKHCPFTRKLVAWDGTTDGAAVGILAVAADQTSTTLTFYKSGTFRYEDVLWPEAASDETKKRTAFAGTAISIV